MVNKKRNIKEQIIQTLSQANGQPVSGVALSKETGVSRVAVWKHITALKDDGINIESGPRGYTFHNPDDSLLPGLFKKEYQNRIFHFPTVTTTMDKAREMARQGAAHLSVVIAENQTHGRGRLNRAWISEKGGLWFTLILKTNVPPPLSYIYNFTASYSMAHILNRLFELPVNVKWPNDLLVGQQKILGLLSEMETRGDMVEFINIGMGLNVNNHPGETEPRAVSVSDLLGQPVSRRLILETFLEDFTQRSLVTDPEAVIAQWKTKTSTIGSQVRVETPSRIFAGKAVDVDDSGALIIEDPNKTRQKIIYGDCFHT